MSREGSACPGCVSKGWLPAGAACLSRAQRDTRQRLDSLPAASSPWLGWAQSGEADPAAQPAPCHPGAQINTCDGRAGGAGTHGEPKASSDCRAPAAVPLSRSLSPGGDSAGSTRQMALCWGWWLCSLCGAFKDTNW